MFNQFFVTRESEVRFFFMLVVALIFFFLISFALDTRVERGRNSAPTEIVQGTFPEVSLNAKSAYVYDMRTKTVLYALDENIRRPLASVTKVMSALVAEELSPEYGTVTITQRSVLVEGDSGLRTGEKWQLKDLLDFSLISSSNDGMQAVALALGALNRAGVGDDEVVEDFVQKMNKKALELSLNNTYFWNPTGLDETELKGGAYSTARDVSMLMEYITSQHPDLLSATRNDSLVTSSLDDYEYAATNTNRIVSSIPGILGSKTGFTDTAGGNLTFVFDPELGRPIVVTILGSTEEGRFEDAKALVDATLVYINGDKQLTTDDQQ